MVVGMETESADIRIDRPADAVWPLVGDFGGLTWMPGVDACTVDGDVRTVSMNGMDVQEKLVALDEEGRSITYSIIGGPVPLDEHESTITVTPDGDGCRVEWSVSSSPDGTAGFLRDIYAGALEALKAKAESEV
jgi:carbon monoxide dehydrogenase subunit G